MQDPDYILPELAALIGRATQALNTHVNDADLCAVCGCAWPCERAVPYWLSTNWRRYEPPSELGWSGDAVPRNRHRTNRPSPARLHP